MKTMNMLVKAFSILLIVCLMISALACGKKGEEELSKKQTVAIQPLPDGAFKASVSIEKAPTLLRANSSATLKIKIRNTGNSLWPSKALPDGKYGINLAYHWIDKTGKVVVFDGLRTPLPHDLNPNEEVMLNAAVATPTQGGEYILEFDLVQELVGWFKDKGSQTTTVTIKIE